MRRGTNSRADVAILVIFARPVRLRTYAARATIGAMSPYHRNPGVAAVLSLVIPGVGQIYNGDFLRGIVWLIVTPGFWIFTAGLFGWPFHLVSAYTAYRRAEKKNVGAPHS